MNVQSGKPPIQRRQFRRHQHIVRANETPPEIYCIEDGWACRYVMLSSGRRQITSLFMPGDYCEPQWLFEQHSEEAIVALTTLRARCLPLPEAGGKSRSLAETRAMIAAMLMLLHRQSQWIASLGRKTACERICALLSDVFDRMQQQGRMARNICEMPLTQSDIADIVGLTPIHVNRVLKDLRTRGLVEMGKNRMHVPNPGQLRLSGSGLTPREFARSPAKVRLAEFEVNFTASNEQSRLTLT